MSTLLLPEEVAQHLRVQTSTVLAYLRGGQLRGCKIARQWRIPQSEVDRFVQDAMKSTEVSA